MSDADRPSTMNALRTRLPALLLVAGLGLVGCSSGGADDAESAEPASGTNLDAAEEAPAARDEAAGRQAFDVDGLAESGSALSYRANQVSSNGPEAPPLREPAVIQVGTMTVQSDDVAQARFDLDKVVDSYGGTIADEKTTATTEGEVRLSRVVLRIPSQDFDQAMLDLAELGKVTASTRKAQDVTAEVIDTEARIRAQEQSLQRVEVLFTRAQSIRDIVAIEAQLSRRQSDLDSLKGQLAYLKDQTTLSTITVYLEQAPDEPTPVEKQEKEDDTAFVAGLKSGWDALSELGAGLATVSGALLPFAVLALVLGVPASVFGRRILARHPLRRPTAEA